MNIPLVLSALSLILCLVFFCYFRAYIRRHNAVETLLAEYRTEIYRLIAEIDAATDRDSRLVEERINTLKKMLDDTDRRLAVYVREQERTRSAEALYTNLGRGIVPPTQTTQTPPAPQAAAEPVLPRQTPATVGKEKKAPPKKPGKKSPRPAEHIPEKPLRTHIAELSEGGLSPRQIASRLGISLSEVETALHFSR